MPSQQSPMEPPKLRIPETDPVVAIGVVTRRMEQLKRSESDTSCLGLPGGYQPGANRPRSLSDRSDRSSRIDDYGRRFREEYPTSESSERYSQHESLLNTGASLGGPVTCRPGEVQIQSLADDLSSAKVPHPLDRTKDWLPQGQLERLCSRQEVSNQLKGEKFSPADVEKYTNYVCGTTPGDFRAGRSAQILFVILVLSKDLDQLRRFFKAGICDRDFPFARGDDNMLRPLNKLNSQGEERLCFQPSETRFMSQFHQQQWHLTVPIISLTSDQTPGEYELHSETIMPWTSRHPVNEKSGHADVFKVEIHPDHHRFKGQDAFALKILKSTDLEEYERELYALRRTQQGPHVIELFATFKRGSELSFLFPWAEGGNLSDLMKQWPSQLFAPGANSSETLTRWISGQCRGIAAGLRHIHNAEPAVRSEVDKPSREWKDNYGIHRDIKPQNILRFTDRNLDRDLGKLMLADFGLTRFCTADSRSLQPGKGRMSASYAAPEQMKEGPVVSRNVDIWALGCVFMMLLTWAIRGPRALERFQEARLGEQDRGHWNLFTDSFFRTTYIKEDEKMIPHEFHLKQAVGDCIRDNKKAVTEADGETNYLTEFLDFILNRMLVIEKSQRAGSLEVYQFLSKKMQEYEAGYHVTLPSFDASAEMDEPECTGQHVNGDCHGPYQHDEAG
ncbi:hypothetical protein ACHAPT_006685 [Fusarium lateritium]